MPSVCVLHCLFSVWWLTRTDAESSVFPVFTDFSSASAHYIDPQTSSKGDFTLIAELRIGRVSRFEEAFLGVCLSGNAEFGFLLRPRNPLLTAEPWLAAPGDCVAFSLDGEAAEQWTMLAVTRCAGTVLICSETRADCYEKRAENLLENEGKDRQTRLSRFRGDQRMLWAIPYCLSAEELKRYVHRSCDLQLSASNMETLRENFSHEYPKSTELSQSEMRRTVTREGRILNDNPTCDTSCATCADSTPTVCLSCHTNASIDTSGACMCDFGFTGKASSCAPCNPECLACVGPLASDCSSCKPAAHLANNLNPDSCVCDTFYFPSPNASECTACDISCATCVIATKCTSCILPSMYDVCTYVCVCGQLFYPDPTPRNCVLCDPTCFGCLNGSASTCTDCWMNAHIVRVGACACGTCVCKASFFPSPLVNNCQACHSTCVDCRESSPTDCISCHEDAHLTASSSCECDSGFVFILSPAGCVACNISCKNCKGIAETQCIECKSNAVLVSSSGIGFCKCVDGFYPAPTAGACSPCNSSCKMCSGAGANACTVCFGMARLVSSSCVCLDGFFLNIATGNCTPCDPSCVTCSGPLSTDCASCCSSAVLTGGTCNCPASQCEASCATCSGSGAAWCTTCLANAGLLSAAPSNCVCNYSYFPDPSPVKCSACAVGCKLCFSAASSDCYLCYSNAVLLNGAAPSSCGCLPGYFPNPDASACNLCDLSCLHCSGTLANQCTACFVNAKLNSETCVCEESYYPNSTVASCEACHLSCLTCHGNTLTDCNSCFSHAHMSGSSTCLCDSGYYPNSASNNCSLCHGNCLTCDGGSGDSCLSCNSSSGMPVGLVRSSCSCVAHYYTLSDAGHCLPCDPSCDSCVNGSSSDCTQCYSNAHLYQAGPCPCVCDLYFYPAPHTGACAHCDKSCYRCSGPSSTACTECDPNAILTAGTCTCIEGYYMNSSGPACYLCHSSCKSCSVPNQCQTCFPNTVFVVSGGTKYCGCVNAFYPNPTPKACSPCHATCLHCTGDFANNCSACYTYETLSPGKTCDCMTSCFRLTPTNHCEQCHATCFACVGGSQATQCTSCFLNSKLAGASPDVCVCNDGFYPSPQSNNCNACHQLCLLCAGLTLCSQCKLNASLQPPLNPGVCACHSDCYFDVGLVSCELCDATCRTCTGGGPTSCSGCKPNATLQTGKCVCVNGFYMNSGNCTLCSPVCSTCSLGGLIGCLTCVSPLGVLAIPPGPSECLCPLDYHLDTDTGECQYCHNTCKDCVGVRAQDCQTCESFASIRGGLATGECECWDGFYPAPHAGKCAACHFSCRLCLASGSAACLDCFNFAVLSGPPPSACECAEDAYPDLDVTRCKQCHPTCRSCSGPGGLLCTACRSEAFLMAAAPSACLCNPGFFPDPDAALCSACNSLCATCPDSVTCASCKMYAELTNAGLCVCIVGAFGDPDASNCRLCPTNCEACFPLGCLTCKPSFYYLDYECYVVCPRGYEGDLHFRCLPADMSPPVPALTITANNTLLVSFDKAMNFTAAASDLSVEVMTESGVEVQVNWTDPVFEGRSKIVLPLVFQVKFLPPGCVANLSFLHPEEVVDTQSVGIEVTSLLANLTEFGPQPRNATKTLLDSDLAKQTATAARGAVAASVVTSVMNGGPSTFVSLVNQMQLITYLAMSKLPLPVNFAGTLAALNVDDMLPNPFAGLISLSISDDSSVAPPPHVVNYGLESIVFLTNAYAFLATSAAILLVYGPVYALSKVKNEAVSKHCKSAMASLVWTTPLNLWLTSYLDIGVQSCLQLTYTKTESISAYTVASLAASCLCAALVAVTPVALIVFVLRNFNLLASRSDEKFNKRWKVLFADLKEDGKLTTLAFYWLFVVRRLVLTVTLTATPDSLSLFAILNCSISVIVRPTQTLLYVVIGRPYSSRMNQLENTVIEGSTAIVYVIAGMFTLDLGSDIRDALDQAGMWAVRAAIVFNLAFALARTALTIGALVKIATQRSAAGLTPAANLPNRPRHICETASRANPILMSHKYRNCCEGDAADGKGQTGGSFQNKSTEDPPRSARGGDNRWGGDVVLVTISHVRTGCVRWLGGNEDSELLTVDLWSVCEDITAETEEGTGCWGIEGETSTYEGLGGKIGGRIGRRRGRGMGVQLVRSVSDEQSLTSGLKHHDRPHIELPNSMNEMSQLLNEKSTQSHEESQDSNLSDTHADTSSDFHNSVSQVLETLDKDVTKASKPRKKTNRQQTEAELRSFLVQSAQALAYAQSPVTTRQTHANRDENTENIFQNNDTKPRFSDKLTTQAKTDTGAPAYMGPQVKQPHTDLGEKPHTFKNHAHRMSTSALIFAAMAPAYYLKDAQVFARELERLNLSHQLASLPRKIAVMDRKATMEAFLKRLAPSSPISSAADARKSMQRGDLDQAVILEEDENCPAAVRLARGKDKDESTPTTQLVVLSNNRVRVLNAQAGTWGRSLNLESEINVDYRSSYSLLDAKRLFCCGSFSHTGSPMEGSKDAYLIEMDSGQRLCQCHVQHLPLMKKEHWNPGLLPYEEVVFVFGSCKFYTVSEQSAKSVETLNLASPRSWKLLPAQMDKQRCGFTPCRYDVWVYLCDLYHSASIEIFDLETRTFLPPLPLEIPEEKYAGSVDVVVGEELIVITRTRTVRINLREPLPHVTNHDKILMFPASTPVVSKGLVYWVRNDGKVVRASGTKVEEVD